MRTVRIENAIKRVHSSPDSWVRVEQVRKIPKGLELCLGVYEGRRGRKGEVWRIQCLGVREFRIDDVDGGGLALYSSTHPAARQFVARLAVLRWGRSNAAAAIGALCHAHLETVDDWIPIDRYVDIRAIVKNKFVCRGPVFLLRAYVQSPSHDRGAAAAQIAAETQGNAGLAKDPPFRFVECGCQRLRP